MKYSKEKLNYLRKNKFISPMCAINLAKMNREKKKAGPGHEAEFDMIEYDILFKAYAQTWNKTWRQLNWGNKEDEGLEEFADGALEQAVEEEIKEANAKRR